MKAVLSFLADYVLTLAALVMGAGVTVYLLVFAPWVYSYLLPWGPTAAFFAATAPVWGPLLILVVWTLKRLRKRLKQGLER